MGFAFCESGRLKKIRDLLPGEIVGQLMKIEEDAKIKINSVVHNIFDSYTSISFCNIVLDCIDQSVNIVNLVYLHYLIAK